MTTSDLILANVSDEDRKQFEKASILKSHPELVKMAKRRGFSCIGAGAHKTVFAAPHDPKHAFVCLINTPGSRPVEVQEWTYNYCMANPRDPYLPRYYEREEGIVGNTRILMYKTARLARATASRVPWIPTMKALYGVEAYMISGLGESLFKYSEELKHSPVDLGEYMDYKDPKLSRSFLKFVARTGLKHPRFRLDPSLDNFLIDPLTKRIVMNDIWF